MSTTSVHTLDEVIQQGEQRDYLWTLNFGPQHPGHAHHAAAGAQAGRRTRGRRDSGYRLSAFRLREDRREPELQPVRDRHRPHELHVAAGQQRGLARRGREAVGHRAHAALHLHADDHLRVGPHQRPFALQRRHGIGHRRVHVLSLRLLSARSALRHLRDAHRGSFHQQLYPQWAASPTTLRRW